MTKFRQVTIPITHRQLFKIIVVALVGVYSFGVYSLSVSTLSLEDGRYGIGLIIFTLIGGVFMIAMPLSFGRDCYSWDLNPAHLIGYCIKLKREKKE